ncbi:MAG TPA: hypothetical protein VGT05_04335 [Patescibacteria group bacterium]|nr:hypothetical protein [Patescibacteria group bacterium]
MQIDSNNLSVTIKNPENTLFQGSVYAVTSYNERGVFDVLPLHANFICLIKNQVILSITKVDKKTIPIQRGVIKVLKNKVSIFLDIESV